MGEEDVPDGQTFPDKIAYVTGSAPGARTFIRAYDKWGNQMAYFEAFKDSWDQNGPGVEVALGDINGDGYPEIIAGEGPVPLSPYGSRFGTWDGKTGAWIEGWATGTHKGGMRVGTGDVDNDGRDEIFICDGPSSQQITRMFVLKYNPSVPNIGYYTSAYTLGMNYGNPNTNAGCHVAGGDVTGDGKDEAVIVFDGLYNALVIRGLAYHIGTQVHKKPFGSTYGGSMSVAVGDRNGDGRAEVFLSRLTGEDQYPPVKIFDGMKLSTVYVLPTPNVVYPIVSQSFTGLHIAVRDINGDGQPELLAKPRSVSGMSMYKALIGPDFLSPWLNRTETGPAGGPIG